MARGKASKGPALVFGNPSAVYYDLGSVAAELAANPANTGPALRSGLRQARFSLKTGGQLLLVDEAMGFPVTLATALRTGAVYEGLDFAKNSSLRCVGGEFFREFLRLLIQPGLSLLVQQGQFLNLAGTGLVVQVAKGIPVALGFYQQNTTAPMNYTQPLLISPGSSGCSGSGPDSPSFGLYNFFSRALLVQALRPLVADLKSFGLKEDALWDIAIEILLEVSQTLGISADAHEHLFIDELAVPNLPARDGVNPTPTKLKKGFDFSQGQVIFLKQSCCEKYRKKARCSNCPANRKISNLRLSPQTI